MRDGVNEELLLPDAGDSPVDIFQDTRLYCLVHNMAIQEQTIHPYCELRQKILIYSDVLVCATLLFRGPDAVRASVGRDGSMNETQLLSVS